MTASGLESPQASSRPEISDDQLVERIRKGESRLFEEVFHRFYPRVFRFAALLTGSPTEAQDLAQETFIRAFRSFASYQPRGRFVNWILAITRNLVLDLRRKRSPELPDSPLLEQTAHPVSDPGSEKDPLKEYPFLNALKSTDREVLLLRVVEELSYDEIAEITGDSPGALRKVVCRSLARLREVHGVHTLPADF